MQMGQIMNIGLYLDNIGNQDKMKEIFDFVNSAVIRSDITDISIFYDDVGYNPFNIQCGFFNSTDLWHFNGTLLTTSIETTKNALKIVNSIQTIYLYDKTEKVNIFALLDISQNANVKIVCSNNDSAKELYRLTNKTTHGISDLNNILNLVGA